MIERFERFSFAISEISYQWHKLSADEMKKYGLKSTHSVYILTLLKYPKGLTAPQLCELCGKDKSDVSRMMAILEQKKLVNRESIYQNMYKGKYKLTEEGIAVAKSVQQSAALVVEYAGKDMTEQERAIFYTALESIAVNLKALSTNGIPMEIER